MIGREKMPMCLWLILLSLMAIFIFNGPRAGATEAVATPPPGLVTPSLSTPMPAFRLEAVNGTTVQATDLLGKVVVVRFWATW
jgi:hypothetical protein